MDYLQEVISQLAEEGAFGPGKFVRTSVVGSCEKGDHYSSNNNYLVVTMDNGISCVQHQFFAKRPVSNPKLRNVINSAIQFENELHMYDKILPLLQADKLDLFPTMYHGIATGGRDYEKDVILLQDMKPKGFRLAKEKIYMKPEELTMAITKLAEFHALSYTAKNTKKTEFFAEVKTLDKSKFTENIEINVKLFKATIARCLDPLIAQGISKIVISKTLNKMKDFKNIAESILRPEEPFAVVCHGDFCRNNIFYKYNQLGEPVDIKFFDLQSGIYSSPAVDLAFILYLNTTAGQRSQHWDDYINLYWLSLKHSLPKVPFSYDEFLEHFSRRAFYGLFPISFFLPMLLEKIPADLEYLNSLPCDQRIKAFLSLGGEEGTVALVEIVKHMLGKKYLEKFLEL